ncbi:MAG: hypothetical protein AABX31_03930 [Nanoarchaeota archaeon]
MANREVGRTRRNSHRAHKSNQNDISAHTLMAMVILVLVVSVLSATLYVYAFYGNSNYTKVQKSLSLPQIVEEKPAASGTAAIEIIKPPEDSEK